MKIRMLTFTAGLSLLLMLLARAQHNSSDWPWPESTDAVRAAPENHKVLYEDDRVRILDVKVRPGEKEKMHHHRWPSILIIDSPAKSRDHLWDGEVTDINQPPTETPLPLVVRMEPEPPHSMENLDSHTLHLYRIELKKIEVKKKAESVPQ